MIVFDLYNRYYRYIDRHFIAISYPVVRINFRKERKNTFFSLSIKLNYNMDGLLPLLSIN